MAISAGDFKTGLTLNIDGDPWTVLDFQHVKPGKGAAFLYTKMKNLRNGKTLENNYNANTKFESAMIEKRTFQYSYNTGDAYCFMDMETYETVELSEEAVGFNKYFLIEGKEVKLSFFEGEVLTVAVDDKVELEVVETTPGIKGAPSSQTKDAVTNTGLNVRVPQFIEQGEMILVTSEDGKYAGRA